MAVPSCCWRLGGAGSLVWGANRFGERGREGAERGTATCRGHSSCQDHVRSRQEDLGTAATMPGDSRELAAPPSFSRHLWLGGRTAASVVTNGQLLWRGSRLCVDDIFGPRAGRSARACVTA